VYYVEGQSTDYGTLAGSGVYPKGAKATVTATPTGKYVFYRWTDEDDRGGKVLSADSVYTFTVTAPITLYAVFHGNGVDFPRYISSIDELEAINENLNLSYEQVNSLDLQGKQLMIGKSDTDAFTGRYNGNRLLIKNYSIDLHSGEDNVALFRTLGKGGVIENLWMWTPKVFGNNRIGAVVGQNFGEIKSCHVFKSNINGNQNVGGLCGQCGAEGQPGKISDSYVSGTVAGAQYVGGITGYFHTGTINACRNVCEVNALKGAMTGVGGIAGILWNKQSDITACYNTGDVTGKNTIGGIVGDQRGDVSACYNIGTLEATGGTQVGAITGYIYAQRNLYESYYLYVDGLKGVGEKQSGDLVDESKPFGNGSKPVLYSGWPAWNGRWTNDYWSDLGGWSPIKSEYPKLWWEKMTTIE
jgi:hypothetical protein